MPPLSLKQSPLMVARALLGFVWKLQLWLLEGGWEHSNYAAVKLVWNILTQMRVESKRTSPSQWIYWGLSRKLLVLTLVYWQRGVEFLLPLLLLLLLVLHCRKTVPKVMLTDTFCMSSTVFKTAMRMNIFNNQPERCFISSQLSMSLSIPFSLTLPGIISRIFAMCYLQSSLDFFALFGFL